MRVGERRASPAGTLKVIIHSWPWKPLEWSLEELSLSPRLHLASFTTYIPPGLNHSAPLDASAPAIAASPLFILPSTSHHPHILLLRPYCRFILPTLWHWPRCFHTTPESVLFAGAQYTWGRGVRLLLLQLASSMAFVSCPSADWIPHVPTRQVSPSFLYPSSFHVAQHQGEPRELNENWR